MWQLKLEFGFCIGESLQFYYDNPNDKEEPIKIYKSHFVENDEEVLDFITLIKKQSFDKNILRTFCDKKMAAKQNEQKAEQLLQHLSSAQGKEIVKDLLLSHLLESYDEDVVLLTLEKLQIQMSPTFSPPQLPSNKYTPPVSYNEERTLRNTGEEKIAELVKKYIRPIIKYCNSHPEEFQNLLRRDYSKEMFDVNFAFFIKESEIDYSNSDKKRNYTKFWKQIHVVHGERVLITSQWFRGSRKYFDKYIELKGLKA